MASFTYVEEVSFEEEEEVVPTVEGTIMKGGETYAAVSVAEEMNPLRRNTMEDVHRVVDALDGDKNTSFIGIYDGHGGRDIVDFLATELERNIASELKVDDGASIPEKMCRAYLLTDVQSRQAELMTSGATAVTCLIKRHAAGGARSIYAANVGDSRAVLCFRGKALRLTFDHKAEDRSEQERIEAAGGFVLRNRVLGILAVTRSFGDHSMKEYVIGVPFTSTTTIESAEESPFLIMACDGVWDVMSDDEAVQLVLDLHRKEGGKAEVDAAGLLVQEALKRGSNDNITCCVIMM